MMIFGVLGNLSQQPACITASMSLDFIIIAKTWDHGKAAAEVEVDDEFFPFKKLLNAVVLSI